MKVAQRGASARNLLGPLVRAAYRVRVTGAHHVPAHGGVLLLSTSDGVIDPMILATCLARPVAALVPAGGPERWRSALGRIVVDPDAPGTALREATRLLRDGQAVAAFPAGFAAHRDGAEDFAAGAGYLQARSGVLVVPVAVFGSAGSGPSDPPRPRTQIEVYIGAPVEVPPLDDSLSRAALVGVTELLRQRCADHLRWSTARAGAGDRHNGAL